jgi:hypothetical protein
MSGGTLPDHLLHEVADASKQFGRRHFGEGHGRDGGRRGAVGKKADDAPRQQRGLAGSGASLDMERAPEIGKGGAAGRRVGHGHSSLHRSVSPASVP